MSFNECHVTLPLSFCYPSVILPLCEEMLHVAASLNMDFGTWSSPERSLAQD